MDANGSSEKRKDRRADKKFVLRVAPQGGKEMVAENWTIVTSKNISAGGVLFTYDRMLNQGTPLTFKIHFPEKTIDCQGTVFRTGPSVLTPLVSVAARLDRLEEIDREYIERYIA